MNILEEVRARGANALHDLIGQEESLSLEFKTLTDPKGGVLTKEDKKILGRAVSGLANADGGLLFYGISTSKIDNLDVATALAPFPNILKLARRLSAQLTTSLSPSHEMQVHPVPDVDGSDRGFIIVEVPRSENRPHMSLAPDQQKYFRRTSEGVRPMDHSEVRDLMLAPRQARCEVRASTLFLATRAGNYKRLIFELRLILKNSGMVPAIAPYLIISDLGRSLDLDQLGVFQKRQRPDNSIGLYTDRNYILHIDDEIECLKLSFAIHLDIHDPWEEPESYRLLAQEALGQRKARITRRGHDPSSERLQEFRLDVVFGAENADRDSRKFSWGHNEICDLAAVTLGRPKRSP